MKDVLRTPRADRAQLLADIAAMEPAALAALGVK